MTTARTSRLASVPARGPALATLLLMAVAALAPVLARAQGVSVVSLQSARRCANCIPVIL